MHMSRTTKSIQQNYMYPCRCMIYTMHKCYVLLSYMHLTNVSICMSLTYTKKLLLLKNLAWPAPSSQSDV